jgi:hypothetical protein
MAENKLSLKINGMYPEDQPKLEIMQRVPWDGLRKSGSVKY